MVVKIDINIENARMALMTSSGSIQECSKIEKMTDEEIIDTVIRHSRCWGVTKADKSEVAAV